MAHWSRKLAAEMDPGYVKWEHFRDQLQLDDISDRHKWQGTSQELIPISPSSSTKCSIEMVDSDNENESIDLQVHQRFADRHARQRV